MLDAADIKQAVEMTAILAWYGLEPNRAGFISCPFHADKTPSLKVYPSGRGWHCFSCERGGSVIDFVMAMEGKTFQEACQMIEKRAGLKGHRSTYRPTIVREYAKKYKQDSQENKNTEVENWLGEVRRYEAIMVDATEWTPELVEACQNIDYAKYRLEAALGFYDE